MAMLSSRRPERVMVTGVGGAPGFDLARALLRLGCDVIGTDADPLACGFLLPVTSRVAAPAGDRAYASALIALCRELRPDALMPTVEAELEELVQLHGELEDLGVRTWLPPLRAITSCTDKAVFSSVLTEHGIPTPLTVLPHRLGDLSDEQSLVVKPQRGQGGKHVYYCSTRRQARTLCELVEDPIVQERITGSEFTADCLIDRLGHASVILRHRLLVKSGLAVVSETFYDEEVASTVKAALAAVGVRGLCCTQGFLRDSSDGPRVVITEMNARVAGAFPLSEAAGADLVGQALNGVACLPVDHDALAYRPGVRLTKYFETLSVGPPAAAL